MNGFKTVANVWQGSLVPQAHRLGPGQAHGTGGVDVVEGAGEGDDTDAGGRRLTHGSGLLVSGHGDDILDDWVGQEGVGGLAGGGQVLLGDRAVHGQLEAAALTHTGELVESEARKAPDDGLALGVKNLGLGHDLDDDASHGCSSDQAG